MTLAATQDERWTARSIRLDFYFAGRGIGVREYANAQVFAIPPRARTPGVLDDEAIARLRQGDVSLLFSHPITERLPRVSLISGALRYVSRQYHRFRVDTTGTFEGYIKTLSPKTRQTLKRKVRKYCAEAGDNAPYVEYRTFDELRAFHKLARRVAEKTYQERLFDAGAIPESPAFLEQDVTHGFGARGYLLMHRGVPIAYLYAPFDHDFARYLYVGYDPAFREWSPGAVLQYFALERMFDDPDIAALDFGEGEGQHKAVFATASTLCGDIYYFRPTIVNALTVGTHLTISVLDRLGAKLVVMSGYQSAIRRLVRGVTFRTAPGQTATNEGGEG